LNLKPPLKVRVIHSGSYNWFLNQQLKRLVPTVLEQPRFRAALWQGSSGSLIDLHQGPFHISSFASAASDGIQVWIYGEDAAVWLWFRRHF
jgi:hypothetical protein